MLPYYSKWGQTLVVDAEPGRLRFVSLSKRAEPLAPLRRKQLKEYHPSDRRRQYGRQVEHEMNNHDWTGIVLDAILCEYPYLL
jgi:hypothetical protein